MKSSLHYIVAILTSTILACPPGCCSVFSQPQVDSNPVPKSSCCHEKASQPCDSDRSPLKSDLHCCCIRDAVVVEKSVPYTDVDALAFSVIRHVSATVGNTLTRMVDVAPVCTGPKRQILFCVWRC